MWEDRDTKFSGVLCEPDPGSICRWDFSVAYEDGDWILENLDECTWRFADHKGDRDPEEGWQHPGDLRLAETEENDAEFTPNRSSKSKKKKRKVESTVQDD